MLIKARMQHEEIMKIWAQNYTIMNLMNTNDMLVRGSETQEKATAHKKSDFMDNFYESSD